MVNRDPGAPRARGYLFVNEVVVFADSHEAAELYMESVRAFCEWDTQHGLKVRFVEQYADDILVLWEGDDELMEAVEFLDGMHF